MDRTSPRCRQVGARVGAVGDQAEHGQVPAGVVLSDPGESEVGKRECGVEAGRVKLYTRDLGS